MGGYNITTILFLVNSFKDIVDSYGYTNKTVELYKRQVESIVASNIINIIDRDLVYELLGIVNTNNIKWTIADNKVSQFLYAVNMIGDNRDSLYINNIVNSLLNNNLISESIANVLRKMYR